MNLLPRLSTWWRGRAAPPPPPAPSRPGGGRRAAPPPGPSGSITPVGAVNGFDILDKVANLPVSTWRYEWEPEHVRHLGPMAQDWKATFDLGDTDTRIPHVDANGVTLVSIQALHRLIIELREEVEQLRARVGQ